MKANLAVVCDKTAQLIMSQTILISLILILFLFFIRLFSEKHLDDVNPLISCDENLLEKSDVFAVIPKCQGPSE